MSRPATTPRLRTFALLSLAAHLSVLMTWQPAVLFSGNKDSILFVSLSDSPPLLATAAPRHSYDPKAEAPSPRQSRGPKDHQRKQAVLAQAVGLLSTAPVAPDRRAARPNEAITGAPMEKTIASAVPDAPSVTVPLTSAEGADQQREPVMARIRARLLSDLARYFDYPAVARQRGWQGAVLVAFRVESDGRLDMIHVAHSSGYAVLDDSALNSLNRLGRLAEASTWPNVRGMDMQLPVIYRLVEN
jgi:protein TonB